MTKAVQIPLTVLLLAAASFAGVSVSSPAPGSSTSSNVHFVASASSSNAITGMVVYVDGREVARSSSNRIDTYASVPTLGWRNAVIKAWDSRGNVSQAGPYGFKVTSIVSGQAGGGGETAGNSIWSLDQQSGWIKCTACAGVVGVEDAPGGYSQNVSSPSMDGRSMDFWIGGETPYRNALWYIGLGGKTSRNLVFDLYFYIKEPGKSQALEFDINQYIDGKKFIFGHQCSPRWSGTWDTWNPVTNAWESTGIPCPVFPAYRWNHVVLEAERTADGKLHYVSITMNGTKHYVHRYRAPGGSSWYGLSVNFQMDGNYAQQDYHTWLDKVHFHHW